MSAPGGETLVDELEHTIHAHVLSQMPSDPSGELAAMNLSNLLITYWSWIGRLISRTPRDVHQSREMLTSAKTAEHAADLRVLLDKIHSGGDLFPHLSKRVATAYVPKAEAITRANQQRADRDVLLAAWGLHHLHLSSELDDSGQWVRRGKDLLIGAFAAADAYLIGTYPHGSWALKELMQIIVRTGLMPALCSGAPLLWGSPVQSRRRGATEAPQHRHHGLARD